MRCVALKYENERPIRVGHFKEFLDETQAANRDERPRQQSPKRIREALTIIDRPHVARESCNACDKYGKEVRNHPKIHVLRTEERLTKNARWELEDIVFTKADTMWVHHPHNSNVHRVLVDDGNVVDIIYLNAYKRMGLTESELSPTTSPLYGFTGDHVIPRGTVKLVVIVGEHPRVSTIVIEFLVFDCLLAVNGIIWRPLLKALKPVTSIYHLTMKFLTVEGTRQV